MMRIQTIGVFDSKINTKKGNGKNINFTAQLSKGTEERIKDNEARRANLQKLFKPIEDYANKEGFNSEILQACKSYLILAQNDKVQSRIDEINKKLAGYGYSGDVVVLPGPTGANKYYSYLEDTASDEEQSYKTEAYSSAPILDFIEYELEDRSGLAHSTIKDLLERYDKNHNA